MVTIEFPVCIHNMNNLLYGVRWLPRVFAKYCTQGIPACCFILNEMRLLFMGRKGLGKTHKKPFKVFADSVNACQHKNIDLRNYFIRLMSFY
jgi:hypothetical protein